MIVSPQLQSIIPPRYLYPSGFHHFFSQRIHKTLTIHKHPKTHIAPRKEIQKTQNEVSRSWGRRGAQRIIHAALKTRFRGAGCHGGAPGGLRIDIRTGRVFKTADWRMHGAETRFEYAHNFISILCTPRTYFERGSRINL